MILYLLGTLLFFTAAAFVTDHVHPDDPDDEFARVERLIDEVEKIEPTTEASDKMKRAVLGELRQTRREMLREGR